MNFWKPIALCSIAALCISVAPHIASAAAPMKGEGTVQGGGECYDDHQPHMAAALKGLRDARAQLDQAEHNKDGWRETAKKSTDQAIVDVRKGCAYAWSAH